jgi:hypothetical protein
MITTTSGRVIYAHRDCRTWKFCAILNSAPMDSAPKKTRLTCYASIENPNIDIAYVGGATGFTLEGVIMHEDLLFWGAE